MSAFVAESTVEQAGEAFRALRRGIARSRGFSLHVCTCDAPASRDQFIANLAASMPAVSLHRIELTDAEDDVLDAVAKGLAGDSPGPVMVVGAERALADDARAQRFLSVLNLRRGEWPARVPRAVVFWLPNRFLGILMSGAPDFFDWRSDTIAFPELTRSEMRPLARRDWTFGVDPRLSEQERQVRLRELRARIAAAVGSKDEYVLKNCLKWWDEVAELELVRGNVDEALRIRQEEELPVYERLGDVRAKAVTMGKIADILSDRGQLDEALRIWQEEELPVYARLGYVRELLVCRANTALTLMARKKEGDIENANALLCLALADARRLGIPEAEQIGQILQQCGMTCGNHQDML